MKQNEAIAEVIAYFRFENQQIFRIHGQVRLIKGDLVDVICKILVIDVAYYHDYTLKL